MFKVSVIIPTYNRAKYLSEAVDSILNQTYRDFEVIIVDDGSMDNTKEVIERYIRNYPGKISYFYQENKGPAAARNRGIKESRNEYIAFLDTDDLWHPEKLMLQVEYFKNHPEIFLVSTEFEYIDNSGKTLGYSQRRKKIPVDGLILEYVFKHTALMTSSILVKREVFEKIGFFDETLYTCEDTDLYLRIAKYFKIALLEKYLTKRRNLNAGLTKNKWVLRGDNRVKVFSRFLQNNKEFAKNNKSAAKRVLSNIYFDNAEEALALNSFKEALNYIRHYFKYRVSVKAFLLCIKIILMSFLGTRIVDHLRTFKAR